MHANEPQFGARLRVSVVIPARDEEPRIRACLAALAAQADSADEIIVVDNGSTDRTGSIAAFAGARVIVEARPGISAARATGFDAATGDIIARIDADTIVAPDWITNIRRAFALDPALDALAGETWENHLPEWLAPASTLGYEAFRLGHATAIGAGPLLYGHNMALRASAWDRIRGVVSRDDAEVSEDLDVALAILAAGGRIRTVRSVRAGIDILRTARPRKIARYLYRDQLTRRKYRRLARRSA